jgi:hypothetical protein
MEVRDIHREALDAYMQVWRDNHIGHCPSPTGLREKKWSRYLREIWPECTVVNLDDTMKSSTKTPVTELKEWCNTQKRSNFWVNTYGNVWYFERKDIAALFKLQFGGECK